MEQERFLNPQQEQFAQLYYAGPDSVRGNATRAYHAAYPECSYESAMANASRLLRHEGVGVRLRELRDESAAAARSRARDWWELYPEAQDTLYRAAVGDLDFGDPEKLRCAVKAAQEIVGRCEGTVTQQHRVQSSHSGIIVQVAGVAPDGAVYDASGRPAQM